MDIVGILIALILFIAVAGIVCWFIGKVAPPQPVAIVVYAVLAIVGLLVLADIAGFDHHLALR